MRAKFLYSIAIASTFLAPASAMANTTFPDPTNTYYAGVGPDGELYDNTTGIGLKNPVGSDYIQPGTPRDSWGITSSAGSAQADYQDFGTSGITATTVNTGTNSATYVSTTASGLTVTQVYNFFASNILSIQETVTNSNLFGVTGIVFRRNVDLDVPPTRFTENTTGPLGSNSAVIANSYHGFENPNPTNAYGYPCGLSCNFVGDLGAGIDLLVGSLAAGDSRTFAYYYGINQPGQTLDQLFGQAQGLGLSYLIGVQSSENGAYPGLGAGSAFLGVSNLDTIAGPGAVPEPATWALMLLGMAGTGFAMRRQRQAQRRAAKVRFAF